MNFHRSKTLGVVLTLCSSIAMANATPKKSVVVLKTHDEKMSYIIGRQIGDQLSQQMKISGSKINISVLSKAIEESLEGVPTQITPDEAQKVFQKANDDIQNGLKVIGDKNQKDGDKFLAENKSKPGVKTTASGLQYKVLKETKGDKPKATDTVVVKYEGRLIDGKVFDASDKHPTSGGTVKFPLNGVIPGWTEGLQLMSPGSSYEFYIPANLAYGKRGQMPDIGPNSALIFKVELMSIEKKAAEAPKK